MSKTSNQQRYKQLQDWDRFMMNEYPNYKNRKKKAKFKKTRYFKPETEELLDYNYEK